MRGLPRHGASAGLDLKLPDAARSLGRSMRILKAEVGSLRQDKLDRL